MQDIQTKAINTYQTNISYFKEKHPDIYKKIDLLSTAIEQGQYQENYSLEYKTDYFDILDIRTNQYLYNSSSIQLAKDTAKQINYKKNDTVIETFYNFSFSEDALNFAKQEDPTLSQYVLTAPIIQFSRDLIDKKHTQMKHIYKFIFFGVGLGLHLTEIDKKIASRMYLIIEDNLEIFRLSLFVTDYTVLALNSELFFSIMENKDKFKYTFDNFYHNSFIRNNYIKYSLFYDTYKTKISVIQEFLVTQSNLTYPQDKLLKKNIMVLKSLHEAYKFFDVSKHYKETPLSQKPLIIVASGPSLGKNIEWLKDNAPYVTIVALFMTLPILEEHNIKPDIIVHIDEKTDALEKTISKLQNKKFIQDSLFFLSPSIDITYFLEIGRKDNIYLFEDRTRYRFNKGFLEAPSVGEIAYALSLLWDTRELYLLGLDLALDAQTKQTHTEGHTTANTEQKLISTTSGDSVSLRNSELLIKGNFRETVPTTPLFDMSRIRLNLFTNQYKNIDQKVYNLNDGAYFNEIIPKQTKDINFMTLKEKESEHIQTLKTFFDKNASSIPDIDEMKALHKRKEDALKKKELILTFTLQKSPTIDQFRANFSKMATELICSEDFHSHELSQVYVIYLENIGGYIGDFLNTTSIKNPKRSIKQFQKILAEQLLKIVNKFLEALETFEELKR